MKNLEQILKKRIVNFGPISISDFILEANLNSKFGYYNNNFPFGEKKDYMTSLIQITFSITQQIIITPY